MGDDPKTDGSAATVTATDTPAEKTATSAASDSAAKTGRDERIDGLKAQIGRKDEQIEKLTEDLQAVREQNKTEQEKLLDAHTKEAVEKFKTEVHEPTQQRLEGLETTLAAEYERESADLPEEQKALIPDGLTVEKRLAQVRKLKALMSGKPTSIGASVNPQADAPTPVIAGSAFREWQQMPYSDKERYEELKPAMQAARVRDGGIDWTK